MSYIYDTILNFNKELIEFFEWDEKDNIKYIKKILLFKTDTKTITDIIKNEVELTGTFPNNIPKYNINNKDSYKICLLTNGKIVIGIVINKSKVEYISRLLLDEEYDALSQSDNLINTKIEYRIIKKRIKNKKSLTRTEVTINDFLQGEIDSLYKQKNKNKLIYLYYEYTGKESQDIDKVYSYLKKSLDKFNDKHIYLYNLLNPKSINKK